MSADKPFAPPATLLLCHHGTPGAAAAATLALSVARAGITRVVHCQAVPELWAGMQGDDWLNNAATRDAFASHLERQLADEARRVFAEVEARCRARGLAWRGVLRVGEPAAVALAVAAEEGADLAVVGPPRKKGEEGLRSRMDLERLVRGLACPLLIASRA